MALARRFYRPLAGTMGLALLDFALALALLGSELGRGTA